MAAEQSPYEEPFRLVEFLGTMLVINEKTKEDMTIRAANRLWRQATRSNGLPFWQTSPCILELRHIAKGRSISTKFNLDETTYDINRDYTAEMTIPSVRYETRVMSFGDGSSGALGHRNEGYLSDCFSPAIIEGLRPNVLKVAAGHYHTLAITENGEVWAWGRNSEGQLGPRGGNSRQEWDQPQRVKGLENVQVTDVAGSGVVSMALAKDGSVWSWGTSKRGQLGLGRDVIQSKTPEQVVALEGRVVSQMALGWGHALVCTTDGELYAWGYAADGRLGFNPELQQPVRGGRLEPKEGSQDSGGFSSSDNAEVVDRNMSEMLQKEKTVVPVWEPRRVEALAHERVIQVACGMDHSLALSETGNLYSFGDNSLGQLGRPQSNELVDCVEFPDGNSKILSCAAGLGHSLAIALNPHAPGKRPPPELVKLLTKWEKETDEEAQGSLFSWGWNSGSQLGRAGDPSVPGLVEGLGEEKLVRLAAGRVHSAGLSSKRQVWTWGSGKNGRLGLDSPSDEPYPFPNEYLGFWRTLQVACGFDHSLFLVRTVAHTPGQGSCDHIVRCKLGLGDKISRVAAGRVARG